MTSANLALEQLGFSYGSTDVLSQLDFSLEPGSVTGLLGRNGSGKTTLMRVALGLLKAGKGSATLFGETAWQASPQVRARIGYVPQDSQAFSWLRVGDCLRLVGSFYDTWDDQLIRRYVHEWEIDESRYIHDLSTGQRQKVAILTAIGHRPDLLVLDEPVAGLDPGARRQFLKALVELNEDLDRTILFSTHITSDIERVVADVAVLHGGRLTYRGELDALKERCRRLYLNGTAMPEQIVEPGIENYQQLGDRGSAFTRAWDPAKVNALAKNLGVQIEAESLPLEELFLELTHG